MQQGLGGTTGTIARGGRGLLDTESYYISGYKTDGTPIVKLNPYSTQVGALKRRWAKAEYKRSLKPGAGVG